MDQLLESIRAAVADGATTEQKQIGVQACRTIMTALDAEPGKLIALPGASTPQPLRGLTFDQALDLVIAKLSTVADANERAAPQPPSATAGGPQIPIVKPQPIGPAGGRPTRRKP